ncbi:uncharacterized protein K452DRAFT_357480 [Aplosporella prunicola CBS 121167]|uniref:Uncharacterized protein n=1 Tax=Aplosporella prunicola CBS 121167 TaxID=1176127 RepID=A0A6A6BIC3_9PEZI|nr:uncharacterized protein K452DRAFT_357480 [Aplosporella prunicola CBS 121167]KAF2143892.1 hypothetical protein K452DRAFT_357480 [Aplosporella prunicola CBS 121167]
MRTYSKLFILLHITFVWSMQSHVIGSSTNTSTYNNSAVSWGASRGQHACTTMLVVPVGTPSSRETLSPYEGRKAGYSSSESSSANPTRIGSRPSAQSPTSTKSRTTDSYSPDSAKHSCGCAGASSNITSASLPPNQSAASGSDLAVAILFGILSFATAMVNIWLQYEALQVQRQNMPNQ